MPRPPACQKVFLGVREVLGDALGVDDDEVTPDAELFGDLGAESIDLLDITFRIEKKFDLRIPRGELFESPGEGNFWSRDDQLTPSGIEQWKQLFPFDDREIDSETTVGQLFTVGFLCQFLCQRMKINWQPDKVRV